MTTSRLWVYRFDLYTFPASRPIMLNFQWLRRTQFAAHTGGSTPYDIPSRPQHTRPFGLARIDVRLITGVVCPVDFTHLPSTGRTRRIDTRTQYLVICSGVVVQVALLSRYTLHCASLVPPYTYGGPSTRGVGRVLGGRVPAWAYVLPTTPSPF
jgi:hypothetical protein